MKVDKSKFKTEQGSYITQSLFLEMGYKTEFAVYTLKGEDHTHKGVVYPSLKKAYLNLADPTEYMFANKYFADWPHWKRLCENKMLVPHFNEWRDELELKLRSEAIQNVIDITASEGQGSFQAAKYLAERGWDKNKVGRPSKEDKQRKDAIQARIDDEFSGDVARMQDYRRT